MLWWKGIQRKQLLHKMESTEENPQNSEPETEDLKEKMGLRFTLNGEYTPNSFLQELSSFGINRMNLGPMRFEESVFGSRFPAKKNGFPVRVPSCPIVPKHNLFLHGKSPDT